MSTALSKVLSRTIWSSDAVPAVDHRVSGLLRFTLPVIDVMLVMFGVVATEIGLPAFSRFYLAGVTTVFGITLMLISISALVGLCFRLNTLEALSKSVLIGLLTIYPTLLIFGGVFSPGGIGAGIMCCIVIPLILWRLRDLGREKARRTT